MTAIPLAILIPVLALLVTIVLWSLTRSFATEGRISKMEARFDLFLQLTEKGGLAVLHHPETPQLDALIEKRQEALDAPPVEVVIQQLPEDEQHLIVRLHAIVEDSGERAGERMAAILVLSAIAARNVPLADESPRRPWWRLW